MAIIDLPLTDGFIGASFALGLDVSESAFQGFYTGNRQPQSTLSDRMTGVLTLPYSADPIISGQREALVFGLKSRGDFLRFSMPHRPTPAGTAYGAVTVAASAAAGARSIQLAGALARPNMLPYSGFEMDTNADGTADGWSAYSSGSTGTVTRGRTATPLIAGSSGTFFQYVEGSALNGSVGIASAPFGVTAGSTYALSADIQSSSNGNPQFAIAWLGAGSVYITETNSGALPFGLARRSVSGVAPVGAVTAQVVLYVSSTSAANVRLNVDNVQLESGSTATPFVGPATLLAGDWVGVGGNLLQVDFAGSVANDAGAMTLPISMPLQKLVGSGAGAILARPTGLWQWDSDAPEFNYTPGRTQGQIAMPLRQVIA